VTSTGAISKPFELTPNTVLAIIAGEGKLPIILAQSMKARGNKVVAFALSDTIHACIAPHVDVAYEVGPGQIGKIHKLLAHNGVGGVVLIGKVPKINLLRNLHKLDWVAIKELSKLPNFNDDSIQLGVGDLLDRNGFKVLTQTEFLRHLFPSVGVLTKRQPTGEEYVDIEYGLKMAKEIARLDIGQTVVVKDRMILAIEAIEGTDETIRRAVKLARGPIVVAKVSKPNQDQRFDIPTVGMNTLDAMKHEKRGGVLAIEAGETMIVEKEEMIAYADANGISIVATSV
jgi:UDP-2,3-diacylglucosamine hydrolase